jgi:site-specific recombinase XerD
VVQGKGRKDRELPIIPRLEAILRDYLTTARPALVGRPRGVVRRDNRGGAFSLMFYPDGRGKQYVNLGTTDEATARARADELAPRPADAGWVFVNASPKRSHADKRAGESIRSRSIFHLIIRVVEPIVGRHVHPHMLRHSFATRVRENDGDLQLIQEALGHASIVTTTMYAHLSTSRRRQKLADLLA